MAESWLLFCFAFTDLSICKWWENIKSLNWNFDWLYLYQWRMGLIALDEESANWLQNKVDSDVLTSTHYIQTLDSQSAICDFAPPSMECLPLAPIFWMSRPKLFLHKWSWIDMNSVILISLMAIFSDQLVLRSHNLNCLLTCQNY